MTGTNDGSGNEGTGIAGAEAERIRLDGVTKRYDDLVAVEEFTLDVEPGELLVLLGPSGCGKTTTLRMICGFEHPTEGEVRIDGRSMGSVPPEARDTNLVFQQLSLFPHMSVGENVGYGLEKAGVDADERSERVSEYLELVDLDGFEDRNPTELSGGQQQRVAIGRALVREPRAFLLDEPFSKLDQKLRIQLQKELKRLQEQTGVPTVFVTHDQEEAMVLADRIAVMDEGKLQQVDTPETLYRFPTNEFVADFIGNPTMNFFSASIEGGEAVIDGVTYEFPGGDGDLSEVRRMAARPEDVIPVAPDNGGGLHATVELVEMRGSTTYLIVDHDGEELTVLQPEDERFEEGDEVALRFEFDDVSLFDGDGELVRHTDVEDEPVSANAE
mgnify:CR=1 FL=1